MCACTYTHNGDGEVIMGNRTLWLDFHIIKLLVLKLLSNGWCRHLQCILKPHSILEDEVREDDVRLKVVFCTDYLVLKNERKKRKCHHSFNFVKMAVSKELMVMFAACVASKLLQWSQPPRCPKRRTLMLRSAIWEVSQLPVQLVLVPSGLVLEYNWDLIPFWEANGCFHN